MVFTKDSGLVKVWVGLILNENNNYTLETMPNVFNLKEVVAQVINGQ